MGRKTFLSRSVYEVYVPSFCDSNGDGLGDLGGVNERLDHLAWLGVDVVWLTPFFPSPMVDNGYDIVEFCDVDPRFGTLDDFDALVAKAHRLGLRLVIDLVANHTSRSHRWFEQSVAEPNSRHGDWYIWATSDDGPPSNWRSVTTMERPGSAWNFEPERGAWYLASFSAAQPDLNWHNPQVRSAFEAIVEFWLDRGVDGFRIDMIDWLAHDRLLRDESTAVADADDYAAAAEHHICRDDTLDLVQPLLQRIHRSGGIVIGETSYGLSPTELVRFHEAGVDVPFNFSLLLDTQSPSKLRQHIEDYLDVVGPDHGRNFCVGNHDVPRVTRYGTHGAQLMALLLLTLPGSACIYYGDELGLTDVNVPADRGRDPFTIYETGLSRDRCRAPMAWNSGPGLGFTTAEPWLPIDRETPAVDQQRDDPMSMLSLHQRLIELRSQPAIAADDLQWIDVGDDAIGFRRGELIVIANFAATALTLDAVTSATAVLVSAGSSQTTIDDRYGVVVPGRSGAVIEVGST